MFLRQKPEAQIHEKSFTKVHKNHNYFCWPSNIFSTVGRKSHRQKDSDEEILYVENSARECPTFPRIGREFGGKDIFARHRPVHGKVE